MLWMLCRLDPEVSPSGTLPGDQSRQGLLNAAIPRMC